MKIVLRYSPNALPTRDRRRVSIVNRCTGEIVDQWREKWLFVFDGLDGVAKNEGNISCCRHSSASLTSCLRHSSARIDKAGVELAVAELDSIWIKRVSFPHSCWSAFPETRSRERRGVGWDDASIVREKSLPQIDEKSYFLSTHKRTLTWKRENSEQSRK